MEEERINLQDDVRPKKNKLLMVFFIVTPLLLGLLIVVVLLLFNSGGGSNSIFYDPVKETQPNYIESVREFQVNLADAGGRRYLRAHISFGFDERKLLNEIDVRQEEIRSEIIALLRAKSVDDLQEPGGQNALRDEIIDSLNGILVTGELKTIYFTEFIIQ